MVLLNVIRISYNEGGCKMDDWMDLNDDGVIDASERMFADEMLCSSREEHMAMKVILQMIRQMIWMMICCLLGWISLNWKRWMRMNGTKL